MGKKKIIKKSGGSSSHKDRVDSKIRKGVAKSIKIKEAIIYVSSSYNNTIISLTDLKGNVLLSASAGAVGFKGTRKGTPFAAAKVAETIMTIAEKQGIQKVSIKLRGIGTGRDAVIRAISNRPIELTEIHDLTSVPHNGCRPKKARRV